MIDSTRIDELIVAARARDSAVTSRLLTEITRLAVLKPFDGVFKLNDLNTIKDALMPAHKAESGLPQGVSPGPGAENGSYAYQLYSAICFAIDARAELKLLELIASPTFYDALMRSAAEKETTDGPA